MPHALPAGMSTEIAKQAGFGEIALLDVQTVDGTNYFWTDSQSPLGSYPGKIVAGNQNYLPYVKSSGPFTFGRDFTTDAGDIILQNLSGNTIDRDVASALLSHEFEGALCVLRLWLPLFDDAMLEFHGCLFEQAPDDDECSFRLVQLSDVAQFNVADDVVSELCTWRYKSAQCGSTGSAATCPKRFTDCKDATRAAQERFNGVLNPAPTNAVTNAPPVKTLPSHPGSGGSSDDPIGGRGRRAFA